MRRPFSVFLVLIALGLAMPTARAEGNLASRATRLDPLMLTGDLGFSVSSYELETGIYYRWRIESDGGEEFLVLAPGLMRNSWINQIVIDDKEVKPMGGIYGVEFDEAGTIDVWFVPIVPGNYDFWVDGFEDRGMKGVFVVR